MIFAVHKRTKEHRIASQGSGTSEMLRCYLHSSDEDLVQADPDGWIEWHGGECPLPDDAEHEVMFGDGKVVADDDPSSWCWSHDPARRIVAYRPILDEQATLAGAKLWQDAEGTIPCREGDPVGRVGEPPAWDGTGLPPVGCECEALSETGWIPARIVAHDGSWVIFSTEALNHERYRWGNHPDSFRPIRSEEEIAVDAMVSIFNVESGYSFRDLCRALYRAGFRKVSND